MKTRTYLAAATGATCAAALIQAAPASAHESGTPVVLGPRVTQAALLGSLVDGSLDRLAAWATALEAKAAAIPDSTVLTGRSRAVAKHQYLAAKRAAAFLDSVTGLTAEQQARVDAVQATLRSASSQLKALLANVAPTAAPVTVVRTAQVRTTATDTRHHCDGFRTGDRTGDRTRFWTGDRTGDWFHHSGFRR